jgi:hypothetical protein
MHPEVGFLGILVINLNGALGKNSIWWPCVAVVSSSKLRFIVQEMRAQGNQDTPQNWFLIKTDSISPISHHLDNYFS